MLQGKATFGGVDLDSSSRKVDTFKTVQLLIDTENVKVLFGPYGRCLPSMLSPKLNVSVAVMVAVGSSSTSEFRGKPGPWHISHFLGNASYLLA